MIEVADEDGMGDTVKPASYNPTRTSGALNAIYYQPVRSSRELSKLITLRSAGMDSVCIKNPRREQ